MKNKELIELIKELKQQLDESRDTDLDNYVGNLSKRATKAINEFDGVVLDDVNEPFYCDIIEGEEGYRCKEQCMSCRSMEDKLTKQ